MKSIIMISVCIIVVICQTVILMLFLKKLKKIELAFWGQTAKKAEEELGKARVEERKKAEEDAAMQAEAQ